ncbi:MAG: ArnT family glycosyltransferase [Candidatus Limivicinus sp.]
MESLKRIKGYLAGAKGRRLLFWLILAAGIFARVWEFGIVPGDINQDEAFAGYEAYSILKYGIDTAGYRYPIYLTAWGSGMNALESYLMMPFIALFGLKVWVIRLPQVIVGCLSIWVVYLLVRRTVNEKAGMLAMFMLAICPWHIIMSRWGLESNLAPGFLLFGLYFFVLGLEKPRFLMLSALMYGLSLYAYSAFWPYIPFIILFELIYSMAYKKIRFDWNLVFSGVILAVLAVPLLIFFAINNGLMDEICTPYFSIPKLLYMRSGELSFDEKQKKLELFLSIFVDQTDNHIWNSPEKFGLFYYFSAPFGIFGLIFCIRELVSAARAKKFCPPLLLIIQLVVSLPQLILVKINATKVNIMFIPVVILIALGIYFFCEIGFKKLLPVIAAVYTVLFVSFECYYFTDYREACEPHFSYGFGDALEYAMDNGEHVYLDQNTFYPKVLFYSKLPVETFRDTVQYEYYPASYLTAISFDRFSFWVNPYEPEDDAVYVFPRGRDRGILEEAGFSFENFGLYQVACKK